MGRTGLGIDAPRRLGAAENGGRVRRGAVRGQDGAARARRVPLSPTQPQLGKWAAGVMLVVVGWAGCGEAFVTAPGGLRQAWSARGGSVGGSTCPASHLAAARPQLASWRVRSRGATSVGVVMGDTGEKQVGVQGGEEEVGGAQVANDVGIVDPDNLMQDAVARALKKADSMLDELSNSEASKARREGRQQIETLKNKKKKQEEDGQKAEQEVKAAKQAKIQRAEASDVYTAAMRSCAASAAKGLAGKAEGLAVLKEMEAIGVTPNQATFAVLMDVLAKAASFGKSKPREGWDILRLMEQRGVVPDAAALSSQLSLMARCAAKGADVSLQDGLKVISFAEERGVEIDAFLFSSLLALCAHAKIPAGKTRLQAALAILKQLSDAGIRRDTVVYNNVLTVCGKCTQSTVADALEILEDMDKNKIEASAYTFSILLSQCANSIYDAQSGAELVEDAEEVMTLMRGRNLPPSVAVYNSWLKVLSKAAAYGAVGAKEASVVLAEMEDLGVRMNVVTLSSWLSVIGNAVLSEKATGADAKVAIVKAREEGLAPPPECYNLWIDAVGREALMGNSTVKDVIGIVEYMRSVGQAPGTSTYNRVMSVAARAVAAAKSRKRGSITDGKAILALMAEDEVPLSPVSLSAFIQLARADGSKDAATEAWKVFDAAPPSVRNEHVFTVMTTALVKAGQKNTAKTMLDLAKVQGLLPNTFMFNAAMGAAEESADVDALWEQMQASGVRADAVTNRYLRLAKKNMAPTRVRVPQATSKRRNISREKRRIKGEPPLDDR